MTPSSSETGNRLPTDAELTSGGAAPSWLNKRVGRFKLVGFLGEGAMGRVFRVEDTLLHRYAALKVLPSVVRRGGKVVAVERLMREARLAATVEHPNAVAIYEVNESGGVHYVAMELVEGGTLRELVKAAGPLDFPRACLLCADAAEALHDAHARGIVHRDVKPTNLMLTRCGRCKVTDFGLARAEGAGDLTGRLPESVGTPQFLAPEIARGGPASAQSDVYSLGATLWYLLTGQSPYGAAPAAEALRRHAEDPLPDLAELRPDLPIGLVGIIQKSLAKSPGERYTTAAEFARVLRLHTIQPAGTAAADDSRPAAAAAASHRRWRRRLAVTGLSALVLLAGGAAAVVIATRGGHGAFWRRSASATTAPATQPAQAAVRLASSSVPATAAPARTLNLLDHLDLATTTVKGKWRFDQGDLVSDNSKPAILEFPVAVPEEYDFRIVFTPTAAVEQMLYKPLGPLDGRPTGATDAAFNWCINANGGFGLELVSELRLMEQDPAMAVLQHMEMGVRHVSVVSVRKRSVRAYLDGVCLLDRTTNYRELSRFRTWTMRDNDKLGLGTWEKPARFHVVELIDRTGARDD